MVEGAAKSLLSDTISVMHWTLDCDKSHMYRIHGIRIKIRKDE